MVSEARKKASELRWKALESGKQADFDVAWAAQCAAEREDEAKDADTSRRLPERLAKVGREIDEVEREVIAVEGARSELQVSPMAAYYPKYIEGTPSGVLPATESPKTMRRKGRTTMGKKPATEGQAPKQKKPRAKGPELVKVRANAIAAAIAKFAKVKTVGILTDSQYEETFTAISEALDNAKATMDLARAPEEKTPEPTQLSLSY